MMEPKSPETFEPRQQDVLLGSRNTGKRGGYTSHPGNLAFRELCRERIDTLPERQGGDHLRQKLYHKARSQGIRFLQFDRDRLAFVEAPKEKILVKISNHIQAERSDAGRRKRLDITSKLVTVKDAIREMREKEAKKKELQSSRPANVRKHVSSVVEAAMKIVQDQQLHPSAHQQHAPRPFLSSPVSPQPVILNRARSLALFPLPSSSPLRPTTNAHQSVLLASESDVWQEVLLQREIALHREQALQREHLLLRQHEQTRCHRRLSLELGRPSLLHLPPTLAAPVAPPLLYPTATLGLPSLLESPPFLEPSPRTPLEQQRQQLAVVARQQAQAVEQALAELAVRDSPSL